MPRTARLADIEAHRVDQAAADEEQAIAGHVAGEPCAGEHQAPLPRFERDGFDAAFVEGRVLEADREEDPGRARQRIGPAMRVFVARLVERRQRNGRAAAIRDAQQPGGLARRDDHRAVGGPRRAARVAADVRHFEHGPAADRHLGELAVREERHPLPVGREERLPGAVGARPGGAARDREARAGTVAASRLRSPRRPAATRRVRARTAPRTRPERQRRRELEAQSRGWPGCALTRPQQIPCRQRGHQERGDDQPLEPPAPGRRHGAHALRLGVLLQVDELDACVADVLQACARIPAQAPPDQARDGARDIGAQRAPVRLVSQEGGGHLGHGAPREHRPAGQHLEQHAPERPDVRPRIDVPARHLLRAHVAGGADDEADLGDRLDGLLRVALHRRRLGEAEVDELHLTPGREHHVRRLEIAVDHALGVRLFEPGDDLHRDRERLFEGQRSAGQAVRQRFTVHSLEDEVGRAIHPLEAVDRGNVRMAERGEDPRLAFEAPQAPRVAAKRVGQALDRDLAAQAGVERAVDAPHAARAQQIEDLIAADVLSEDEPIAGRLVRDHAPTAAAAAPLPASRDSVGGRYAVSDCDVPCAASACAPRSIARSCSRRPELPAELSSIQRSRSSCDSSRTAPSSVFRRAGSDRARSPRLSSLMATSRHPEKRR